MAIKRILQYPDSRLSIVATPVSVVNDEVRSVVKDMFETHYAQPNCAALAASQLDLGQSVSKPAPRITVIDFSQNKDTPLCLINPVITEQDGQTFTEEGCMSVARVSAKVRRAESITVEYLDEQGVHREMKADGFMAKCIQHEIDHLDGKLFIDKVFGLKKTLILKKLKKLT